MGTSEPTLYAEPFYPTRKSEGMSADFIAGMHKASTSMWGEAPKKNTFDDFKCRLKANEQQIGAMVVKTNKIDGLEALVKANQKEVASCFSNVEALAKMVETRTGASQALLECDQLESRIERLESLAHMMGYEWVEHHSTTVGWFKNEPSKPITKPKPKK